jgi:hypothetical protein
MVLKYEAVRHEFTVTEQRIWYESETLLRDAKRVQPSLLLRTPKHPTESLSMTESFLLVVCFNTLHVLFHVDGLERCRRHH